MELIDRKRFDTDKDYATRVLREVVASPHKSQEFKDDMRDRFVLAHELEILG